MLYFFKCDKMFPKIIILKYLKGGFLMIYKIKNRNDLLKTGDIKSRDIVLKITEATLQKLDSYKRIKSILSVNGHHLIIGKKKWDLSKKNNIYLIGAGKACNAMALAIEKSLGSWLTKGIAIVKIKEPADKEFVKTQIFVGGHPLPNENGLLASKEILSLIEESTKDDLFICVMSGGSSALMNYPIGSITLQDEIKTTDILLKSGAGIVEINSIRRHISQINGGRMAQKIREKGAELIGINISDSISNPPTNDISIPWDNFSGTPMGPDQTTFDQAKQVIAKYDLKNRLPKSVITYIEKATIEDETPKAFPQNTYYQINTLPDSCTYAKQAADEMGISSIILSTFIEGEAKDVGTLMASIAREIQTYHRPITPPCLVLSAGEAVTTIKDNSLIKGFGGPSQEMALSFAIGASKAKGLCFLSIDSEGTDGTSMAAGGITDSQSLGIAMQNGIDIYSALRNHSSFEALKAINSSVLTGNTGTNICDINILYVPAT